jgi:hypothetical protein
MDDKEKTCKNCQCRKGRHFPRTYGLVCPAYKNNNNPKYFEELN